MQRPDDYIGHHTEETEREARIAAGEEVEDVAPDHTKDSDAEWLQIARDAYITSDDYFSTNVRKQVEKNLSLFQSKHPAGSKYHLESYKFRSKIFRPKTRSMIRRMEAAGALAFFATADNVVCQAEDPRDRIAVAGAQIGQALMQYRLEYSIPWFITVIGGLQDAATTGVVISRQEWLFEQKEIEVEEPLLDEFNVVELNPDGTNATQVSKRKETIVDKPDVVLVPVENFRFDPACDWRDPAGTSPYLVELIPMYIHQVMEKALAGETEKGGNPWRPYTLGEIQSALKTGDGDTTRQAREGKREDSRDIQHNPSLYDICWVHRNIVRVDGEDLLYYTLGTELLLTEPAPVTKEFRHGRPYRVGFINLETHKPYPAGHPELGEGLQVEANDTVNQRMDNQKLALNRRHYARRGTNVDWRALTNSVPGGVVLMDSLDDVKPETVTDVTGSSFQEQDRLNVDFDELMGGFSTSSVQTNRSMNETVGGMSMALDDANVLSEYQLRLFTETWVEPVLKQVLTMERLYETDKRLLTMAGTGTDPELVNKFLQGDFSIRVAVGFGATSPQKRVEKLAVGLSTVTQFVPGMAQSIDGKEITKEVFGALGFRDGSRFFRQEDQVDPQVAELQAQLQELQQIIQTKQIEQQGKLQIAQIKADTDKQLTQFKAQQAQELESYKIRLEYIDKQIKAETNDIKRGELILQQEALEFQKMTALAGIQEREIQMLSDERNRLSEVLMNDRYGIVPDAEDMDDGKKKEPTT